MKINENGELESTIRTGEPEVWSAKELVEASERDDLFNFVVSIDNAVYDAEFTSDLVFRLDESLKPMTFTVYRMPDLTFVMCDEDENLTPPEGGKVVHTFESTQHFISEQLFEQFKQGWAKSRGPQ